MVNDNGGFLNQNQILKIYHIPIARIRNARQEYKMLDIKFQLFSNTSIYDALHDLVSFGQFKKREKHS